MGKISVKVLEANAKKQLVKTLNSFAINKLEDSTTEDVVNITRNAIETNDVILFKGKVHGVSKVVGQFMFYELTNGKKVHGMTFRDENRELKSIVQVSNAWITVSRKGRN